MARVQAIADAREECGTDDACTTRFANQYYQNWVNQKENKNIVATVVAGVLAVKLSFGGGKGSAGTPSAEATAGVPGRVQSRINQQTGDKKKDWVHIENRHVNSNVNASQSTIEKNELQSLSQSKDVVSTPVSRVLQSEGGLRYLREVNVNRNIWVDKSIGKQTFIINILTDRFGNLVTAFPGRSK